MSLNGKVCLVTGASRGIGLGIALEFAKRGAKLAVNSSSPQSLSKISSILYGMGVDFIQVPADLSVAEKCFSIVDETVKSFNKIDVLVNNAGVNLPKGVDELTLDDWSKIVAVNLTAPFLCSKRAASYMVSQRSGRIINIASIQSFLAIPNRVPYASTKSGILGLTRALALELARYNITVNAIAPGFIETDMVRKIASSGALNLEKVINKIPLGRLGKPDDVAKVAAFLASDDASYITGQIIIVDGGFLINAGV
jgi:3-oxoacyl-[acyl-carrier protein] reductase